jgi:hypothetical protein
MRDTVPGPKKVVKNLYLPRDLPVPADVGQKRRFRNERWMSGKRSTMI